MGPQGLTGRHTYHPQSFCSHCLWAPPIARSPCPSLPRCVCSAQHCPLLVLLHFLVCLPWLGPSEAPQRTLRGQPRQSPWLPCFGLGEALSCKISIAIPPGGSRWSPRCFRSPALQAPLTSGQQPHSGMQQTPLCSAVLQRGSAGLRQWDGSGLQSLAFC